MRAHVAAAVILTVLAGCAGGKTVYQRIHENRTAYIAAHPETDRRTREAIRTGELRAGMSSKQVVAAWGRPIGIYRFEEGRLVEWVFGCDYPHYCVDTGHHRHHVFDDVIYMSRAYFYDGKLSDWRR